MLDLFLMRVTHISNFNFNLVLKLKLNIFNLIAQNHQLHMDILRKKQEQDAHTIVMRRIFDFIERNKDRMMAVDYGELRTYLSVSPHLTPEFIEEDITNTPENINLWKWIPISSHKNIPLEFIIKHPEYPWNWHEVSKNPNLTPEFIEQYPDLPWNWSIITSRDIITMEFVEKHPHYEWDWYSMSFNSNLTFNVITENPGKRWYWEHILESNTTIPFENLDEYQEYWNWDMFSLSGNPALPIEFIIKNRKHLDWRRLTCNSSITMDIVEAYPELPWDPRYFKHNPNITPEFIIKHPDYEWDMGMCIGKMHHITPEFIISHPEYDLIKYISFCANLTPEFVKEHPECEWDWNYLLSRFEITPEFIEEFKEHIASNMYSTSSSPHISMEYINEHTEFRWLWYAVMKKEFRIEFEEELEKIITRNKRKYAVIHTRLLSRREMGLGN
jgi:hypothetical protein